MKQKFIILVFLVFVTSIVCADSSIRADERLNDSTESRSISVSPARVSQYASLTDAINKLGEARADLIIDVPTSITASTSIPSNIRLLPFYSGGISLNGHALTINGPFEAGLYPVFSGHGAVKFSTGSIEEAHPEWWGVDHKDDSLAIQRAIDSAAGIAKIKIGQGYTCRTTILISVMDTIIDGDGGGGASTPQITFNPKTALPLFKVYWAGNPNLTGVVIKNLIIASSNSVQKTAVLVVNASHTIISNIRISSNFTSSSNTGRNISIGVQLQGREMTIVENCYLMADRPLSIEKNPERATVLDIDCDHLIIRNLYAIPADSTQASIWINSGVNLTNFVLEGTNAFARGKYGLYWNDTEATRSGLNMSIRNVRVEQLQAGNSSYAFYMSHNAAMQNVLFENCFCGHGNDGVSINGFYFKNILWPVFRNVMYDGTLTAFTFSDSGANNSYIKPSFEGVFTQPGSKISMGVLSEIWGTHKPYSASPLNYYSYWDLLRNDQYDRLSIFKAAQWTYQGKLSASLGPGSSVNIPITRDSISKAAVVTFAAYSDDLRSVQEGAVFIYGNAGTNAIILNSTPKVIIGQPRTGEIGIVSNGLGVQIRNNMLSPVNIVLSCLANN